MRTEIILTIALVVTIVGPGVAEEPVDFADALLKTAVEEALWLSDPTPTDMLGLTELISPNTGTFTDGIEDLTGLEHAANLQVLNLRYHQVSDLSVLSGLVNLETLIFYGNRRISDIAPLSELVALRKLDLTRNEVRDTSVISGLTNLTWLSLHRNRVSDISALSALTSLNHLDLRINPLNQEAYDTYLQQIRDNNPGLWFFGYDPSFHRRLLIDSTIGGSVVAPGEGAFTYEFGETLWVIAEADPCFAFADFSGTYTSSQNPIPLTMDQDYEIWANFESALETIYVNDDAAGNAQENGSAAHPFDRIQEAIDVAARGTRILVHPGTYRENISFRGKRIQVTGIDPNDPDSTDYPVLDGGGKGPVVSFTESEDPNCLLKGFVITGGQSTQAGAILCENSSPTIANCLIVGNRATDPNSAAISCVHSNAIFTNCTVADNYGGGFHVVDSNTALVNSIVWGNAPDEIAVSGHGEVLVHYSDIAGGFPGEGNLDADPLFARHGYWADPDDLDAALIPQDPRGVWISGDYHLKSQAGRWDPIIQDWVLDAVTSPCIDAGDPSNSASQELVSKDEIVNMGAYGGSAQASLGR